MVRTRRVATTPLRVWALLLLLCSTSPSLLGAAETPPKVVQEIADAVVAVLAQKGLTADQKREQVQTIVYAHFDFTTLSRLVLARNWKRFSPEQQQAFVDEFKRHLSMTYGKNVEAYNNERAEVIGDRAETGGDWTVKTKIVRPGAQDILVDYRLRQEGNDWKVIDVIIEGVSLVANFRSQFQEIVAAQGPQKLIEILRDKNVRGEPLKTS
ncbi:MAG: ABC transporter substrate-binding protein [Candidatus Binatia bacterium]